MSLSEHKRAHPSLRYPCLAAHSHSAVLLLRSKIVQQTGKPTGLTIYVSISKRSRSPNAGQVRKSGSAYGHDHWRCQLLSFWRETTPARLLTAVDLAMLGTASDSGEATLTSCRSCGPSGRAGQVHRSGTGSASGHARRHWLSEQFQAPNYLCRTALSVYMCKHKKSLNLR